MKNKKRERIANDLQQLINNKDSYYIGPKKLGNYGRVEELSYKELKYLTGHTKRIFQDERAIIVDKKAQLIAENIYDNGNGNIFFVNIYDRNVWTRYFNKEDSKIIRSFYKKAGKKKYIEIKEDLMNIVNEEKIKRFFNKYVFKREVQIDDKKYIFSKYKEFRKLFSIISGFGRSWQIKAGNKEAIVSIHTITYYEWIEIIL